MIEILPCRPDQWLVKLAEGWRFDDDLAPDIIPWNGYGRWPIVLLRRAVC